MILKLKDGDVKIELFQDKAPNHVKRIKELADKGLYDNVVFHRVIDGFMAQVGDVQFGNSSSENFDLNRAGTGGSDLPKEMLNFFHAYQGYRYRMSINRGAILNYSYWDLSAHQQMDQ